MHRIEGDGYDDSTGKKLFTGGDPLIPTPATQVTAAWANAVQEELALTIEGLGGTLATEATDTARNQLLTQLNAKFGRLDTVNTWASNQSIGGFLAVTGTSTLAGALTANGGATFNGVTTGSGLVANGGPTNGRGITATGTGTAPGINATGGTTSAAGVEGVGGSPAGVGVLGQGSGSGAGVSGTGGPTGNGVRGVGGTTSGMGVYGIGSPAGGEGVRAQAGVAATASVARNALGVVDGYIGFATVNPDSNVAFQNAITPANFPKAWGVFTTNGSGGVSVTRGHNITSAAITANQLVVTFAYPFESGEIVPSGILDAAGEIPRVISSTGTSITIALEQINFAMGAMTSVSLGSSIRKLRLSFIGLQ